MLVIYMDYLQEIYAVINAIIYWLEGYLVLFTIVSLKPMFPELYDNYYKDNRGK